jgi:hypothetical protein
MTTEEITISNKNDVESINDQCEPSIIDISGERDPEILQKLEDEDIEFEYHDFKKWKIFPGDKSKSVDTICIHDIENILGQIKVLPGGIKILISFLLVLWLITLSMLIWVQYGSFITEITGFLTYIGVAIAIIGIVLAFLFFYFNEELEVNQPEGIDCGN